MIHHLMFMSRPMHFIYQVHTQMGWIHQGGSDNINTMPILQCQFKEKYRLCKIYPRYKIHPTYKIQEYNVQIIISNTVAMLTSVRLLVNTVYKKCEPSVFDIYL